ncbi:protein of unknown function [Clostridium collagenovorans DSM 3089]|uniref:DUF4363 family protein n=1 Tax=Clostridium collagenovorans DSM 3089 TaxID=1121306 RepID=A0A1M5XZG0_9CLOT|nr:DUF4363 family protein [Clostridium collagenovorans]SHI04663.1 protein of unknown function [Clostridium collagenovorans DSM 3089]
MKNIITSTMLFLAMAILIFFCSLHCKSICKELNELSTDIEHLVDAEEWSAAFLESINLSEKWEYYSKFLSVYTNDIELDIISDDIINCSQCIKTQDLTDSMALINVVKHRIKHIEDFQKFTLENLL